MENKEQTLFHISILFLMALLIGSIVFYKERMLFVDPAFITFEIINSQSFIFSEHRYGSFITQLVPLIGEKVGLSLKGILILYSASFYMFFITVSLILGCVLKQYRYGILLALYFCLFVSDVYFWPNNEIHQAVTWMMLFLGLYEWSRGREWNIPLALHFVMVLILGLAIISHVLLAFPILFIWVYRHLDFAGLTQLAKKHLMLYSMLILAFLCGRFWLSHDSWYDGAKLQAVNKMSVDRIGQAFTNEQALSFYDLLISTHWSSLLILILGLWSLWAKKKYRHMALTVASIWVYFLAVTITFPVAINASNLFYFESEWMSLAIILAFPFAFESIRNIKKQKMLAVFLFLIFAMKTPYLYRSLNKFQDRLEALTEIVDVVQNKNISKGLIYNTSQLKEDLMTTWGFPVETILLSSIRKDKANICVKIIDEGFKMSEATDSVYTAFRFIPISKLNQKYFRLNNEKPYQVIGTTED